jgi:hypothetical protein
MSQDLTTQYNELIKERHKLDTWFNKYLDLFSDKMTALDKTDPTWKLYDSKSRAYSELNKNIKTVEYRLKRGLNV